MFIDIFYSQTSKLFCIGSIQWLKKDHTVTLIYYTGFAQPLSHCWIPNLLLCNAPTQNTVLEHNHNQYNDEAYIGTIGCHICVAHVTFQTILTLLLHDTCDHDSFTNVLLNFWCTHSHYIGYWFNIYFIWQLSKVTNYIKDFCVCPGEWV